MKLDTKQFSPRLKQWFTERLYIRVFLLNEGCFDEHYLVKEDYKWTMGVMADNSTTSKVHKFMYKGYLLV